MNRSILVAKKFSDVGALSLVIAVGVAGCQAPTRSPDQTATDTAAILSAMDSLAATVGRAEDTGDAGLFASTWAEDGIMSLPGGPPIFGRDAIVAAFRSRPPLPPDGKLEIHPIEIRVLSADWAYAFGVDTLTYTPPGEQKPRREESTFLVLVRKTPAGWKTYREVLSASAFTSLGAGASGNQRPGPAH